MAVQQPSLDQRDGLAHLQLRPEYRSDTADLVGDFYVPCLRESVLYQRAVGYFTSRGLSAAAQGLTELINGDGRMLLIASPLFDSDDLEAIDRGYLARHDAVTKALLRNIEASPDAVVRDRLGYLAWLIAEERLEIRIAVPTRDSAVPKAGIYHEKMGLFVDDYGNLVAFTGSPNETAGGLVDNFESIDVFWSWDDAQQRAMRKRANFDRLWRNETQGLSVVDFPEAAREQLLRYRPKQRPVSDVLFEPPRARKTAIVPRHTLWNHQVEAIVAWENNGRHGIVSMATGSGKTLAALVAAERCPDLALLVVAVPRTALVDQWIKEITTNTGFRSPVAAYDDASRWQEPLFNRLRASRRPGERETVVAVGTVHSLSRERFDSVLRDAELPGNSLLIVDEVHNVGAPTFQRVMRSQFGWRLGLSATPARAFDEQGTEAIRQYFGGTVYVYDLRRALNDGHLCPYRYYVYPAHLSEEEYTAYLDLTNRITWLRAAVDANVTYQTNNVCDFDSDEVQHLLFQRARILKKCATKVEALEQALSAHPMARGLIYCADNEQLLEVQAMLRRRQLLHLVYTANTAKDDRLRALDALAKGHIPCLLAIDCLDEGVDVPVVDQAIIVASSSNKRQFIQRRGRILRRAPGKELATLVDIIVLPPPSAGREAGRMLKGELARVKEMAELAENKYDALQAVKRCASPYGILLTELLSGEGDG